MKEDRQTDQQEFFTVVRTDQNQCPTNGGLITFMKELDKYANLLRFLKRLLTGLRKGEKEHVQKTFSLD